MKEIILFDYLDIVCDDFREYLYNGYQADMSSSKAIMIYKGFDDELIYEDKNVF